MNTDLVNRKGQDDEEDELRVAGSYLQVLMVSLIFILIYDS